MVLHDSDFRVDKYEMTEFNFNRWLFLFGIIQKSPIYWINHPGWSIYLCNLCTSVLKPAWTNESKAIWNYSAKKYTIYSVASVLL